MSPSPKTRLTLAVDESPKPAIAAFLGFQAVLLIISGIALTPVIVLRAAGQSNPTTDAWAVFAVLMVSGITTILQGRPLWRFGSGYPLFMGTSGSFIAVCIVAVAQGGLALMGTLVATSALLQFFFAYRLYWFRKIITPEVGGVVVMLIVVTVFPVCTDLMNAPVPGTAPEASALTAGITFLSIVLLALFGGKRLRLWGPFIGIVIGCIVGATQGLFKPGELQSSAWVGIPLGDWPGMDLSFGLDYWTLLPGFLIVTIVGAIETYGDAISIQRVSHHRPRPLSFKVVQNALFNDGLGNFLSGILGTMPNTTYSTSISLVEFTGVAARRVAVWGGSIFIFLAFFPKFSALLRAIPSSVVGAYLLVLLAILFISGLRLISENGLDYERGVIVSLSFWIGVAFQNQVVFPEVLPNWLHAILDNGMTAGGIAAIVLTGLVSLKNRGARSITIPLTGGEALMRANRFLQRHAKAQRWDNAAIDRLQLVTEEAISFLKNQALYHRDSIRLSVEIEEDLAHLELATSLDTPNLGSEIESLSEIPEKPEDEAELRILRAMAQSVEHQQFSGRSFLSLTVKAVAIEDESAN